MPDPGAIENPRIHSATLLYAGAALCFELNQPRCEPLYGHYGGLNSFDASAQMPLELALLPFVRKAG